MNHISQHLTSPAACCASLRMLSEDIRPKGLRRTLRELSNRIENGVPPHEAIEQLKPRLPPALVAACQSPQAANNLFSVIPLYFEAKQERDEMTKLIWIGLAQPIAIVLLAFALMSGLMIFVIPQFGGIFESFGVEPPTITRLMIWLSAVMIRLQLTTGVIAVLAYPFLANDRIRHWLASFLEFVPVLGMVVYAHEWKIYLQCLAELLSQGMATPDAARLANRLSQSPTVSRAMRDFENHLDAGLPIDEATRANYQLPAEVTSVLRMVDQPKGLVNVVRSLGDGYYARSVIAQSMLNEIAVSLARFFISIMFVATVFSVFAPLIKVLNMLA